MTKWTSRSLVIPMILSLQACGSSSSTSQENKPENNVSQNEISASDGLGASPVTPSDTKIPETSTPSEPIPTHPNVNANFIDLKPLSATGLPDGIKAWEDLNPPHEAEALAVKIFDGIDPVKALLGVDPKCSLYLLSGFTDAAGQANYIFRTSFSHNNESHPFLISPVADANALSLLGKDQSAKDQIFIKLEKAADLSSALSFNLKWFHINHYDTGVCESLKLRN